MTRSSRPHSTFSAFTPGAGNRGILPVMRSWLRQGVTAPSDSDQASAEYPPRVPDDPRRPNRTRGVLEKTRSTSGLRNLRKDQVPRAPSARPGERSRTRPRTHHSFRPRIGRLRAFGIRLPKRALKGTRWFAGCRGLSSSRALEPDDTGSEDRTAWHPTPATRRGCAEGAAVLRRSFLPPFNEVRAYRLR